MAVKFFVSSLLESTGEKSDQSFPKTLEFQEDQRVFTIGRSASCSVKLLEPDQLVSRDHARVERRINDWILTDRGSVNGTVLNGNRLEPFKEYPLNGEDAIEIANVFFMKCSFSYAEPSTKDSRDDREKIRPEQSIEESTENPNDRGRESFIPENVAASTVRQLARLYWDKERVLPTERGSLITQIITKALHENQNKAEALLDSILARFPLPNFSMVVKKEILPQEKVRRSRLGKTQETTAYPGIMKVLSKYTEDIDELSEKEVSRAIERINNVLSVFIEGLASAIRDRRRFERQLEVDVTWLLSPKQNPLMFYEETDKIGQYLFSMQDNEQFPDEPVSNLKETFSALTLHQLGKVKGFQEGLQAFLNELAPENFERIAWETPIRVGPISLPRRGPGIVDFTAWKIFKNKHRELADKDNLEKIWEDLLAPAMAKGYENAREDQ